MLLFADTSAWSRALRADDPNDDPVARTLLDGLAGHHTIVVTGLVLQEILQGLRGPKVRPEIIRRFRHATSIVPTFDDHIAAAELRNRCRAVGVQVATVDATLAALCIRRELTMLTADRDFEHLARHEPLQLWAPGI